MKMKKLFKQVENTVGRGEIARYEQFLFFPQCFQKTCSANTQRPGFVWKRVRYYKIDRSTEESSEFGTNTISDWLDLLPKSMAESNTVVSAYTTYLTHRNGLAYQKMWY